MDYKDGNTSSKIDAVLTAGGHIITLYGNESGVSVDKVILTKNLSCIPTGFGTNCPAELPTNTPTPVPFSFTSNPQATNIRNFTADITWSISEGATGQVEYGLSTSYGQLSVKEPNFLMSHRQALPSLLAGRVYHYRVISQNAAGAQVISGDATFTTLQNTPTPTLFSTTQAPTATLTPTPTPKPTSALTSTPTLTKAPTPTPFQQTDNIAPTIVITNPTNLGLVLKKNITNISANVTDNNAVSYVEFYVNDSLLCRNFTSPYNCSWFVPAANFKLYKITVKAFDYSQNSSSSTVWAYSTWR